jgi:AmmeMemoRadiSam system protein B
MPESLPRLRLDLDFMPSPDPERPGLLIRDPYHYSDAALIVPPALVPCLQMLDGERTDLDMREALVELTGELEVGELQNRLLSVLSEAGFLHDDVHTRMKRAQHDAFAQAPERLAAFAGAAYPAEVGALKATLAGWLDGNAAPRDGRPLIGIAAPHVSPEGGASCYGSAYGSLGAEYANRTFVILGTSHYGEPERFGLTRKPFVTPLGRAVTDTALVDRLVAEGGPAVAMEDYCHAVEHSIEFQVVFLQHLFGPEVKILPILCGPFARSVHEQTRPEDDAGVEKFLCALAALAASERDRLFWVLGIDLAHMGRRYGDAFAVEAGEGQMVSVGAQDRARLQCLTAGDIDGFWADVQRDSDPLKWCGSAPLYAFLRAVPAARAEVLRYAQWNIDPQSVVTFSALGFREA